MIEMGRRGRIHSGFEWVFLIAPFLTCSITYNRERCTALAEIHMRDCEMLQVTVAELQDKSDMYNTESKEKHARLGD